jgi:hypothetical protein
VQWCPKAFPGGGKPARNLQELYSAVEFEGNDAWPARNQTAGDLDPADKASGLTLKAIAESLVTTPLTSESLDPPKVSTPRRTLISPTGWRIWIPTAPSPWVTMRSNSAEFAVPA